MLLPLVAPGKMAGALQSIIRGIQLFRNEGNSFGMVFGSCSQLVRNVVCKELRFQETSRPSLPQLYVLLKLDQPLPQSRSFGDHLL